MNAFQPSNAVSNFCASKFLLTASRLFPLPNGIHTQHLYFLRDKLPREKDKLRDKIPAKKNEKPFNGDFDPKNRQEASNISKRVEEQSRKGISAQFPVPSSPLLEGALHT
ncbi:hypothetical protein CEXT_761231 [Caerostris extrusa]|uniref:Uncharacterized protein n=1 Tax=Caerostris extrusa TaxID=172846 RepID=A0AAV4Q2F7_CAEEX|nr:hypothetical protein CEXT_761231 [Caerostris extrusa]